MKNQSLFFFFKLINFTHFFVYEHCWSIWIGLLKDWSTDWLMVFNATFKGPFWGYLVGGQFLGGGSWSGLRNPLTFNRKPDNPSQLRFESSAPMLYNNRQTDIKRNGYVALEKIGPINNRRSDIKWEIW